MNSGIKVNKHTSANVSANKSSVSFNQNNLSLTGNTQDDNDILKEKYFLLFDSLKVESDKEQSRPVDSKTSTSSAFSEKGDEEDLKNIIDDEQPLEIDFLSKKRKRKVKNCLANKFK